MERGARSLSGLKGEKSALVFRHDWIHGEAHSLGMAGFCELRFPLWKDMGGLEMNGSLVPRKVLAVCLGNICRSPTIEAVLRRKAGEVGLQIDVDSAGTAGYHVGSAPDSRAIRHGAKRDYALAGLRARRVELADFEKFDLILAADEVNLRDLNERCPADHRQKLRLFLGDRALPDPYYGDASDFEGVLDLVEERVEELLREWTVRNTR